MPSSLPIIKVVGVSASGKSTLVKELRQAGYDARPVSQEHSAVRQLWKQFGITKVMIYLDVSLEAQQARRSDVEWDQAARAEEIDRLSNAQENAELRIDTSQMQPQEVCKIAFSYLESINIRRSQQALPPVQATGSALRPVQ